MKIVQKCRCGKTLTEKNFASSVGPVERFGLPKGTLGNTRARFIKLKCECGEEYVGETAPGKTGGSIRLNRIIDVEKIEPIAPTQTLPDQEDLPDIPETEDMKVDDIEFPKGILAGCVKVPEGLEAPVGVYNEDVPAIETEEYVLPMEFSDAPVELSPEEVSEEPEVEADPPVGEMSFKELRQAAKGLSIKDYIRMNKAQLIEAVSNEINQTASEIASD